ncbi:MULTISPECIES: hypothetical protein [Lawsonibacter]|uniref:Uncharacterized protein n=1 Tax=Lawsonibacter hominis TaxID=2763053 RepID=A0A8J6IZF7_9FIRM|nr:MULTISPECIES: hypothetical protein [Lawsonibacter]MBC5732427.1 hypothetical protein [Lawsonibacter hominis]MCI6399886.1 hypothetical protein [Lawsonibacter sp.]MDY2976020.1 hypothetical protein [Oscillospiraceae bacterium]
MVTERLAGPAPVLEQLGILLAIWGPFLTGLLSFALLCVAARPRPPRRLRVLAGLPGAGILLWALWYYLF